MTRIQKKFSDLKEKGRKAFIAFIIAGDPSWEKTFKIISSLEKAGVDILELGVPFSDPMADGPVIQRAGERALINGVSLNQVLINIKKLRKISSLPILLFTYYNPVLKMGLFDFPRKAKESGADGALITDLSIESCGEYKAQMDLMNLDTVFLTAPTTPMERLKKITNLCSGFVYHISRTGVTGIKDQIEKNLSGQVKKIKQNTNLPVAVGFGISKPKQVEAVAKFSDGVVVGSAIVKKIEETKGNAELVGAFVKELIRPIR